jgi:hypothetical protein
MTDDHTLRTFSLIVAMVRSLPDGEPCSLPDSMMFYDITFIIDANTLHMDVGPQYCTPHLSRISSNGNHIPTVKIVGIDYDCCFAGMDDIWGYPMFPSLLRSEPFTSLGHGPMIRGAIKKFQITIALFQRFQRH